MAKKVIIAVMLAVSAACAVIAAKSVKELGVLEPYPEAKLLSDEESEARPVYNKLNDTEKSVYEALYRGVSERQTKIPLPYEISGEMYSKVYCVLEKQESSFFYIDSMYYTAERLREAQIVMREDEGIDKKLDELEKVTEKALSNAPSGSDYEKALYVHDFVTETCEYVSGENKKYSSTVYGSLVEGEANCEGYAKGFGYLANKLGLQCIIVTGTTDKGENHAWNQVKIDGDWYNVDTTWDDMDTYGEPRRLYFLCDDNMFGKTHFAENNYFQPFECTEVKNNYYVKNDLMVINNESADSIIERELRAGNTSIDLRFSDSGVYDSFKKLFIEEQHIFETIFNSDYNGRGVEVTLRENEPELCITLYLS